MQKAAEFSIHDHFLLGYEVNASKREIVLRTEYRESDVAERVDVIFYAVSAYNFVNDSFGTILLEVEETDPDLLVEKNWAAFEKGWTAAGWPGAWACSKDKAAAHIEENSLRAFYVHSSIGMSGWVLAKSVGFRPII